MFAARLAGIAFVVLAASAAGAQEFPPGEGPPGCGGEGPSCNPPDPSGPPTLPEAVVSYGHSGATSSDDNQPQIYSVLSDGVHTVKVGGVDTDYITTGGSSGGAGIGGSQQGNPVSGATFSSSLGPVANVQTYTSTLAGFNVGAQGSAQVGLIYQVKITARDEAAAQNLRALLNTSGAIAHVQGASFLSASGYAYSAATVTTGHGIFNYDYSIADALYGLTGSNTGLIARAGFGCDASGFYQNLGTAGCGNNSFDLPVNFVSAQNYGGSDLDFIGNVSLLTGSLASNARFNPSQTGFSVASSYLDPEVLFANGLDASQYTLTVGDGQVANVAAVPEPGEWAMMLAGFGVVGALMRRRRAEAA